MKKPPKDFTCTPRELEQQIAIFFADAERGKIPMTDAALCYAVGLPYCRYRHILSVADRIATRAETPDKLPQDVQIEHALVLQRGVLRLISFLQASKSPNDILATKQPHLGGFTDKGAPEASAPPAVTVILKGADGRDLTPK